MMKPYPSQNLPLNQRVFNYRLSRARRVVENVFGIAATRFRIFIRPIIASIEKFVFITKAVVALHNFLMSLKKDNDNYNYCPNTFIDQDGHNGLIPGEWRGNINNIQGLEDILQFGSNNYSKDARKVRDDITEYFNNEGSVDWQWDLVNRTSNQYD